MHVKAKAQQWRECGQMEESGESAGVGYEWADCLLNVLAKVNERSTCYGPRGAWTRVLHRNQRLRATADVRLTPSLHALAPPWLVYLATASSMARAGHPAVSRCADCHDVLR